MKPATKHFHLYRGDTWEGTKVFRIDDVAQEGDLASVRMQIKAKATDTTALVELTSAASQITILSAADRRFQIPRQAISIAKGRYVHDIEATFTNGEVRTYLQGRVTVDQDVTR